MTRNVTYRSIASTSAAKKPSESAGVGAAELSAVSGRHLSMSDRLMYNDSPVIRAITASRYAAKEAR